MKRICSLLLLLIAMGALTAQAQQLAFPGAEGWGRFAKGGRGGSVYHVTNLNDSGAGSFRDAVSGSNRIVVFDVAGVININSRVSFASNLYIAGQTAPGEGITLYGDGVSFSAANNLICRYLRVRMGHGGTSGKDCAGVAHGTDMIFDHCSFAWGLDETFSINSDNKGELGRITLQNCVIGQGLMPHSAGGLIQADQITLYRNLYCDNSTRNNKIKGVNQYANNIVYNWQNDAYIMGDSEGQSYANIQSNLFVNGPSGGGAAFSRGNGNFHFYGVDNWQDSNRDGVLAPFEVTTYSASDRQSKPYDYPALPLVSGKELMANLLPTVGASLPYRDMTDCYMIDEVLSCGAKGELIANEGVLPYGIPSSWTVYKGEKRVDTDGDGMPDWWEKANGTDASRNDAMTISANGYANIENYINSITADQRDYYLRRPMNPVVTHSTTTTLTLAWADYTYEEEGFVVEVQQPDGTWKEAARTAADVASVKLSDLTPGTAYSVRVQAFGSNGGAKTTSTYSDVLTYKTRPVEVGVIDIDTYEPDYTWTSAVTEWNTATLGWEEGKAWSDDGTRKVLFSVNDDAPEVTIPSAVHPASVVVTGEGTLTLSGSISGETTSVNKGGSGTLVLNGVSDYKGATVLHEGVLEFATLKNGGVASSIGASQEFAQNWLMDGGTYRYTGASTATNRSARLLSPTAFEVANKAATVQMNGIFEGSSDLIIGGAGKVQVASPSFFAYTGRTVLRGGELFLSTLEASKNGVGASSGVTLAGGRLSTKGENEAYETYSFPIYVQGGTYSYLAPHRNCYLDNTVTGNGTVELVIPYVREYVKGNWTDFRGRLVANAVSSGNLFLANSSFNMPNAVVELKNGARACNWATDGNAILGGLSGAVGTQLCGSSKQTDKFKCQWHIGSANTDETFNGIINDWSCSGSGHVGTVSIEKTGTGLWRLTGANTYSGTTTVSAGQLIVNGVHTGLGAVTVASDATLSGMGTLPGNVVLRSGAMLLPGDTTINNKVLTVGGTVTLQSGSSMTVPVRNIRTIFYTNRLKASTVSIGSNVTLTINLDNVSDAIPDGRSLTIFATGTKVTGEFAEILPAQPSPTQEWDLTNLYTRGTITVRDKVDPNAIGKVEASVATDDKVYTLDGRATSQPAPGKVYIKGRHKVVDIRK